IGILLAVGNNIFAEPPNKAVARIELDSSAAYSANTHDRMIGGCSIAHEEQHAPSGHALIGICPSVTKVAPNVLQRQAGDGTIRCGLNELDIRPHKIGKCLL